MNESEMRSDTITNPTQGFWRRKTVTTLLSNTGYIRVIYTLKERND